MDITSYLLGKQASGGGGSTSDYFDTEINTNSENVVLKKVPTIVIADNVTSNSSILSGIYPEEVENVVGGASLTSINNLFANQSKLKKITINGITSTNINSLQSLFNNSPFMESITIENLNTDKVTNVSYMFSQCQYLVDLDLSWLTTKIVSNVNYMFLGCTRLKNLDLRNMGTHSTSNFRSMFHDCTSLEHLDIRNFNFANAITTTDMFNGVPTTCEIIVKSDTEKTWFATKFPDYTNVKTVAEYES